VTAREHALQGLECMTKNDEAVQLVLRGALDRSADTPDAEAVGRAVGKMILPVVLAQFELLRTLALMLPEEKAQ
jgi:hypothetical protein